MADSLIKASSGASAQAFTTLMLFPLDKIKTLLQVSTKSEGALSVARRIVAANGVLALWWGMGAKLQQAVYSKFTFFYIFSAISSRVTAMLGGQVGTFASLAVGYAAALLNTGPTLPVEVATNIIMANKGGRGADGRLPAERSLAETIRAVHAEKGVAGLYSGGGVITLGLCLNPALEFGLIERFKAPVLARQLARGVRRPALSVAQSFLFGALSKIVATLVTFPLIRAKVLIQTAGKAAAKASCEASDNDDDDDDDDDGSGVEAAGGEGARGKRRGQGGRGRWGGRGRGGGRRRRGGVPAAARGAVGALGEPPRAGSGLARRGADPQPIRAPLQAQGAAVSVRVARPNAGRAGVRSGHSHLEVTKQGTHARLLTHPPPTRPHAPGCCPNHNRTTQVSRVSIQSGRRWGAKTWNSPCNKFNKASQKLTHLSQWGPGVLICP
jgi:adenine nucleotide transporter 17